MKNVLFIGSELFFGTSVGGFRQDRWIKAFLESNYNCTVIDYFGFFPKFYSPSDWTEYSLFRDKIKKSVPKQSSVREGLLANSLRLVKHFFILEVFNPIVWIKFCYIYFLLRGKKYDLVFTSTPPFTSTIFGLILKRLFICKKLVVDFRDEWAGSMFLPKKTFMSRKAIERIVVQNSLSVITVSQFSKRNLIEFYGFKNIECVYNAPDINYSNNLTPSKEIIENQINFSFLYTGSLAPGLFNYVGLSNLIEKTANKFKDYFQFKFLGSGSNFKKHVINENIEFISQQSLEISRRMQQEADALLFLAANFPDNGGIVSSKIFEYLQSGKSILPLFVCEGSDVYNVIKSACGFCPVIHEWDELESILTGLNKNNVNERLPHLTNKQFLNDLLEAYPRYIKSLDNV